MKRPRTRSRIIFIIGGVMSGIGKGITTAALGSVLKASGYSVTALKADPYINVDAGTMNPVEHGEVFVTDDGLETDQDLGNYERFLNTNLTAASSITTGQIYLNVIQRERNLEYQGRCVEAVPDIPEEIMRRIELLAASSKADFVIVEIGGTVGEYQNLIFFEAARLMRLNDPKRVATVLVSYLPTPSTLGEMKTKPTQHAVRLLNEAGIQPDFVVARAIGLIDGPRKEKIARFCNVAKANIIAAPDARSIYETPLLMARHGFGAAILKHFGLKAKGHDFKGWRSLVAKIQRPAPEVKIGIVGKYFKTGRFTLADSYISVIEAIRHAAWALGVKPVIEWLNCDDYERDPARLKELGAYAGIIIPGGFGKRGVEGKILAAGYARQHKIPFLGLCYGMQMAVIEFAREVLKYERANTTEADPKTRYPIFDLMPEQLAITREKHFGGSMRLGGYNCELAPGSLSRALYKKALIRERHRHRYEFNNKYRPAFEKAGLKFTGLNPERSLVEIIELPGQPFFIGTQFHPEFTSRPLAPQTRKNPPVKAGRDKRPK